MRKSRLILLAVAASLLGLFAVFGSAAPAMASTPAHVTQPVAHSAITNGAWPAAFKLVKAAPMGMSRTSAMLDNTCGATIYIVLYNDQSEAVSGTGEDNPAQITSGSANQWTIHCPSGGMSFFNGVGNCLATSTLNNNAPVITSDSSPCTDGRRLFGFTDNDTRGDWATETTGYRVFVYADASGELLGTENSTSFWTNWCGTNPNGLCI